MDSQSALMSLTQQDLEQRSKSAAGKQLLAIVAEKRKEYVDVRKKVFQTKNSIKLGEEAALAKQIDIALVPAMNAYSKSVNDVLNFQKKVFKNSKLAADAVHASGRDLLIAFGALAVVLGAVMAFLLFTQHNPSAQLRSLCSTSRCLGRPRYLHQRHLDG